MLAVYRQAATLMDTQLLPAADALDQAKDAVLEREYRAETLRSSAARFFIIATALVGFVTLVGVQMFLSQRTHRTFNLLLLAATLTVAGFSMYAVSTVSSSYAALRGAKEDAFTSVHALWRARVAAYAARTDERRLLLDPAHTADEERDYLQNAERVARVPINLQPDELLAAIRDRDRVDDFSGYLADEVNNITFSGERSAAVATLAAWQRYTRLDAELHRLERSGQQRKALELCLGDGDGEEVAAFRDFDEALGQTLAINQRAFVEATGHGKAMLSTLELEAGGVALLLAVLIFLGFAPRLREYR